ncbi:hypothetical protein BDQ17DRAFT_1425160 [Cyathus striatus]|nr:hypothetical protein BDQ17DRAFT_1425160 [Cyathus striatus]
MTDSIVASEVSRPLRIFETSLSARHIGVFGIHSVPSGMLRSVSIGSWVTGTFEEQFRSLMDHWEGSGSAVVSERRDQRKEAVSFNEEDDTYTTDSKFEELVGLPSAKQSILHLHTSTFTPSSSPGRSTKVQFRLQLSASSRKPCTLEIKGG